MRTSIAVIAALALLSTGASADEESAKGKNSFAFEPVMLDSDDSTGSTLGVQYRFKQGLWNKNFSSDDSGELSIDPTPTLGGLQVDLKGQGTVAADEDRNPKNFLDAEIDAKARYSAAFGSVAAGAFGKYETDQGFDNREGVYGLKATYAKYAVLGQNDFVALDTSYGRVDPQEDEARQTALGTTDLEGYYRWDAEFLYMLPLHWKPVVSLELNYRYYREKDPPAAVEAADLVTHQLATARLGLKNDLYLAYSVGKLPFDLEDDRIFEVGFSYKLQ